MGERDTPVGENSQLSTPGQPMAQAGPLNTSHTIAGYKAHTLTHAHGYRRTLVGLKQLGMDAPHCTWLRLQTNPSRVEAESGIPLLTGPLSYRRTLVGLKPTEEQHVDPSRCCYRRTLVGLKPRVAHGFRRRSRGLQTNPSRVEARWLLAAADRRDSYRRTLVGLKRRWLRGDRRRRFGLQTNPSRVEARAFWRRQPLRDSYRRTLVGLKRV